MSFNNLGKPIPNDRKSIAYGWLREIDIQPADRRRLIVDSVSEKLEHDEPYESMEFKANIRDRTGCYRMIAILITDAEKQS